MSDFTPMDQDDSVVPVGAASFNLSPQIDGKAASTPSSVPTIMDHDDEVIPANASAQAAPMSQDDATAKYRQMMSDPNISADQLHAFYKSISGKDMSDGDAKTIADREILRAAHHSAGNVQVANLPFDASAIDDKPIDTRPTSFALGMQEGAHHVFSNIAGGVGYLGNKVGLTNDLGGDVQRYYDQGDQSGPYQGSSGGKLLGSIMAAAPAALIAAPVAAGVGALGAGDAVATGAGMLADGAAQSALTTDSKTAGGVLKDAAIGGGLSLGFGTAAHALSSLASAPTAAAVKGRQVLDVAKRLDVQPLPGDVGGTLTKGLNAAGEAGLVSNIPLSKGVDNYLESLKGVRDQAAQSFLPANVAPKSMDSAAVNVLHGVGGLGDYEARSAEQGGKLYDQAAALTGGTQIETPRTLATVNSLIAQAENTPGNTPGLANLIQLRDDLTPGADQIMPSSIMDQYGNPIAHTVIPGDRAQFAINNLRALRTSFGDNFDVGQRAARENAKKLWGPLSDDIQSGLRSAGRDDAADAYKAADQHWAQRQQNLDDVVNPILGNRSHELLSDKLTDLSRNDSDLLGRGLDLMAPDQAAHVKAALIGELGKSTSGQQNAAGDAFSIAKYGTDWDKLSDGVKQHLLSGDAGGKLQDLAKLSEAAKASNRYRNTSGTARSLDALNLLRAGISGTIGIGSEAVGGALTAGSTLAAQYGVGRALASPAVARGIVKLGEVRPFAKSAAALSLIGQRTAPVIQNSP